MGKCITKAIQTYLGTFGHNDAYPRIIQAYIFCIYLFIYLFIYSLKTTLANIQNKILINIIQ